MESLLGFSAVAIFFVIFWIAVYPRAIAESIIFKNDGGAYGHFISALTWLMILGVVNGIYWLLINAA